MWCAASAAADARTPFKRLRAWPLGAGRSPIPSRGLRPPNPPLFGLEKDKILKNLGEYGWGFSLWETDKKQGESVMAIETGIKGEKEITVERVHLASSLGSGLVDVFATAMMIAYMEAICVESVQPCLAEGQTTVGVHIDVAHLAATPVGMKARFSSELVEISPNGKGLLFNVEARDDKDIIGKGTVRRVIVDKAKFEAKTLGKKT